VKLQQSEWVFFTGSLLAVIDMKGLAMLKDKVQFFGKFHFFFASFRVLLS